MILHAYGTAHLDVIRDLGFDTSGQGPTVLLLPALSSISTRREMWPLQHQLSSQYRTVSVDWPGFGDQARPALDWTPAAYAAFLEYILDAVVPSPRATRQPMRPASAGSS